MAESEQLKTPGDLMRGQLPGGPAVPGVLGTLPMASGSIYRVTKLSENEEAQLQKIGVDTSQGLSSRTGEIVQRIIRESQAFIPPEAPDFKPTGKFNPTPLDQLPPETQARIRVEIAAAQLELAREESGQLLGNEAGETMKIQPAFEAAKPAFELFDDSNPSTIRPDPAVSENPDPTGSNPKLLNCPHCGWDLATPDDVEVTANDKLIFLHACLGDIPFEKTYELMAGAIQVTFRTLTGAELDVIFKEVSKKVDAGELPTPPERWEMISRFRLALQIKRVDRDKKSDDFPDGYCGDSNPGGKTFWTTSIPQENLLAPMDWIEQKVKTTVMRNEFVFRMIFKTCSNFGRLVSRLEEMSDRPDFWQPTGASP